jgi:hypothetical protein
VGTDRGHDLGFVPVCCDTIWGEPCRDRENHAVGAFLVTMHIVICNCEELDARRSIVTGVGWNMSEEVFCHFEKAVCRNPFEAASGMMSSPCGLVWGSSFPIGTAAIIGRIRRLWWSRWVGRGTVALTFRVVWCALLPPVLLLGLLASLLLVLGPVWRCRWTG